MITLLFIDFIFTTTWQAKYQTRMELLSSTYLFAQYPILNLPPEAKSDADNIEGVARLGSGLNPRHQSSMRLGQRDVVLNRGCKVLGGEI